MKFFDKILSSGIYLLALLMSLQTRLFIRPGEQNGGYFEYGTISLYGTDILLILVICFNLFYLWQKHKTQNTKPKQNTEHKAQTNKLYLLIIGLNVISLISIFFAADKLIALQAYLRLTLGMGLFFLVTAAAYDRLKLIYAFLAGAALQATLGIWQFLSQATFASSWLGLAAHPAEVGGNSVIETIADGRWLRAYGGLDHPNMLGGLLAVSSLIIIYLILRNEPDDKIFNFKFLIFKQFSISKFLIKQIIFCLLFFIYLTALFFTFSRGAWIGLAVGLIVILAFNFRSQNRQGIRKLIILGAGSIVLAVILFFNYQGLVTTRLSGTARLEIKSNQERTASYQDAFKVIKSNWLTGVGIGGYTQSLVKFYPSEPSWFYQPTHNTFLLVFAETGIGGLILFICIFVILINPKSKISNSNKIPNLKIKNGGNSQIGIWKFIGNWDLEIGNSVKDAIGDTRTLNAAILFSLITMSLVDHYLWSLHFGVLFFWFLLGLIARIEPWTDLTRPA